MNQLASILSLGAAPAAAEPRAAVLPRSGTPGREHATFNSVLDRAVKQPAGRDRSSSKAASPGAERIRTTQKHDDPAERRPPVQVREKAKEKPEDQCLAGACAVNGQATPPEPTPPPNEAVPPQDAEVIMVATKNSEAAVTAGALARETSPGNSFIATLTAAAVEPVPTQSISTTAETRDLVNLVTPSTVTMETDSNDAGTLSLAGAALEQAELQTAVGATLKEVLPTTAPTPITEEEKILSSTTLESQQVRADGKASVGTDEVLEFDSTENAAVEEEGTEIVTPPEVARDIRRAARQFRSEAQEGDRGTSGAQLQGTMNTSNKKEDLAGFTQQFLPSDSAAGVSAAAKLPGEVRRNISGATNSGEAAVGAVKFSPAPVRVDVSNAGETAEVKAAAPIVRVNELVSREVRMFRRGGDDLVEVVLTPDVKTQLSLRLQWRDGQVEVQARCDFGDYRSLNTQWAQLQTSMAAQGVRLSHLSERVPTGLTDFFNNPAFSQQQQSGQQQTRNSEASDSGPTIKATPTPNPVTSRPARVRGSGLFDSWA